MNNQHYDSSQEKAEILNQYFHSIFTIENTNFPHPPASPNIPAMKPITVTTEGIENLLNKLNSTKAAGPDQIPLHLLKMSSSIISPVLRAIYQQSLDSGKLPTEWKHALVTPSL